MKLTNKILLSALALLLIATTALAIKLTSLVEYTPQPLQNTFIEVKKRFDKIKELEAIGGFNIEVFMSDKDSLEYFGPDLLVKKHTLIEEKKGRLRIVSEVNLANYSYNLRLKLFVKNLEGILLENGATLNYWLAKGSSIKVIAKDSSLVKISNGEFNYARLEPQDKAIISLEKTKVADVRIKDKSMVVVSVGKNGLSGILDKEATLIANGKVIAREVLVLDDKKTSGVIK